MDGGFILHYPYNLFGFGFLVFITLYTIQFFFGIFSLSHPDNAFIVNELVTPKHTIIELKTMLTLVNSL